jgi:hypothetical protein
VADACHACCGCLWFVNAKGGYDGGVGRLTEREGRMVMEHVEGPVEELRYDSYWQGKTDLQC